MHKLFMAMGSPVSVSLYSIPYHPTPVLSCAAYPLLKVSAVSPGLYFSTSHHYLRTINISFIEKITCHYYPYKAI